MELRIIEKPDQDCFVQDLIDNYRVEGVKRKEDLFSYGPISSPDELSLDFDCTILPPKKYFLPQNESLFRFTTGPSPEITPVMGAEPFVLFGVQPYDLKAINQMDQIFATGIPDPHYLKRREAALLIGIDPTRVAPRAFWADMEAATVSNGFDLMFTDIGEGFVVEVGTQKGGELLRKCGKTRPATREEVRERVTIRSRVSRTCARRALTFPKREIPRMLEQNRERIFWEEQGGKCLGCGACNMVCPTCYCFDIHDEMGLDLVHGERFRCWDGCLLEDFAKVATGENFRETRTSRYRHRFFRKGVYLFKVLDDVACVGCGRCASSCLPDIADPVDALNYLKENER